MSMALGEGQVGQTPFMDRVNPKTGVRPRTTRKGYRCHRRARGGTLAIGEGLRPLNQRCPRRPRTTGGGVAWGLTNVKGALVIGEMKAGLERKTWSCPIYRGSRTHIGKLDIGRAHRDQTTSSGNSPDTPLHGRTRPGPLPLCPPPPSPGSPSRCTGALFGTVCQLPALRAARRGISL
jgi:hypothetical protein